MPLPPTFAAVDLGASSGRVILGHVGENSLSLDEVHRFANTPVRLPDGLHWDALGLYLTMLSGLRVAAEHSPLSMGIDSWAVDYGLLDKNGVLIGNPYHYRDKRNLDGMARVHDRIDAAELYRINGLQQLPINTIYQLAAADNQSQLDTAETLLLIPDLLVYWLTSEVGAEQTNASTTGIYDATRHCWSQELLDRLGIPLSLLPELRSAGNAQSALRSDVSAETGLPTGFPVITVASHDTASAVAAVPAVSSRFAYISCGTWSLAGQELDAPVLSEESRTADFTNELGVDGTIRYLRNVMGLWLVQECIRSWRRQGQQHDQEELLSRARAAEPFRALIDPTDPDLLAPEDMPSAIARQCRRTAQDPPPDAPAMIRCILESLALAHRHTLRSSVTLSGREIDVIHVVGGGSKNELLCQLTADACGLPVIAGPSEATALGNILTQARAHGVLSDRDAGRRLVAATQSLRHYEPQGNEDRWRTAAERIGLA